MAVQDRIWTVYWTEWGAETYLYGSKICFHAPDDVEFENALMPPGTVIKTWHSMVDYQERRLEPQLPIIDGEGSYHVSVSLEADVPEGIYLRFVFFGKNGDEAGSVVVDQPEADLRCPLKTYSYDVQLICAGAHVLRFHSFTIEELDSQC